MLDALITSKTRMKLLLKFFLNSNSSSYLRGLESEFGESSNAIRLELNRFEEAGLLQSCTEGNKKVYSANTHHPLFGDIHNILLKHIGFDKIVERVVDNLGELQYVYVVGDFAKGIDSNIIDLLFVGEAVDREYLTRLVEKAEKLISRKIRFLVYGMEEIATYLGANDKSERLLLWQCCKEEDNQKTA